MVSNAALTRCHIRFNIATLHLRASTPEVRHGGLALTIILRSINHRNHRPIVNGRDNISHQVLIGDLEIVDTSGKWEDMPTQIEEAVYGGLTPDHRETIENAIPETFPSPVQAIR